MITTYLIFANADRTNSGLLLVTVKPENLDSHIKTIEIENPGFYWIASAQDYREALKLRAGLRGKNAQAE